MLILPQAHSSWRSHALQLVFHLQDYPISSFHSKLCREKMVFQKFISTDIKHMPSNPTEGQGQKSKKGRAFGTEGKMLFEMPTSHQDTWVHVRVLSHHELLLTLGGSS